MELINEQWEAVSHLFPMRRNTVGRPAQHPRDVLNGIFWIFRTGAQWSAMPDRYPPYQTCHRWYLRWSKDGTLKQVLSILASDLEQKKMKSLQAADPISPILQGHFTTAVATGRRSRSWMLDTDLLLRSSYAQQICS